MISINKETFCYLVEENDTVSHNGIANVCFDC
ncbi:Uncharacterised protein [Edwardsiella ictaluri]|nr:Uncharacterised protein [Edwardsiella ictaluri]